jgi:hypothetical protein
MDWIHLAQDIGRNWRAPVNTVIISAFHEGRANLSETLIKVVFLPEWHDSICLHRIPPTVHYCDLTPNTATLIIQNTNAKIFTNLHRSQKRLHEMIT